VPFNLYAANNTANYVLVEAGINGSFDTASCAGGVQTDDVSQTINSISYSNNGGSGPFVATLSTNMLTDGYYRLFACGTTSIHDLFGNELNGGLSDPTVTFRIDTAAGVDAASSLPATGFPQGQVTTLPGQLAAKDYADTSLRLEIPSLDVSMPIVGVPLSEDGWDVTWLGNQAGYLIGTAYPTWAGNTVITGHVWDAQNNPGVFAELKSLRYGDQIQILMEGKVYTYEVRERSLILPRNVDAALAHEDYDWVTLITCEDYNLFGGTYELRRMVRAVLVEVK